MVAVQNALGMVLCHDMTRIVPGESKGRAFRKGHIVREEDIPELLKIGKEKIYVFDLAQGFVHEDDAALHIAGAAAGPGIILTAPSEGRVDLIADRSGLLTVNVSGLNQINEMEDVVMATLHGNQTVEKGRAVAGTRIIPLVTPEKTLRGVDAVCRAHDPLISVKPFRPLKVGIVTTGSEIYHGRIEDKFGPVLHTKFAELGCGILRQIFVSDDVEMTVAAIHEILSAGADLVAVTGGMSVDPDDQTPAGIRAAGGRVETYGAPTFPGAMFMLAYIGEVPVVGLPGCVMYFRASIFDLVVPRLVAGEHLTKKDITVLGHGGFCAGCKECRYPVCGFGKSR